MRSGSDGWICAVISQKGRRQTSGLYKAVGKGTKSFFPEEIMSELNYRRQREGLADV